MAPGADCYYTFVHIPLPFLLPRAISEQGKPCLNEDCLEIGSISHWKGLKWCCSWPKTLLDGDWGKRMQEFRDISLDDFTRDFILMDEVPSPTQFLCPSGKALEEAQSWVSMWCTTEVSELTKSWQAHVNQQLQSPFPASLCFILVLLPLGILC